MRFIGIEPPKRHDVSPVLRRHKERLPAKWQGRVEEISAISQELAARRSEALYGDEETLTPASELFGQEDARRAVTWVDELLELCEELIRGSEG